MVTEVVDNFLLERKVVANVDKKTCNKLHVHIPFVNYN